MARTRTLAELRADVANEADLGTIPSGPFTAAVVNRYINQSIRKLVKIIHEAHGEEHWQAVSTFNTVADTAQYSLPADFYQLTQVSVTIDGTTRPIRKATPDMLEYDSNTWTWRDVEPRYRVIGSMIELAPVPDQVYSVKLRYRPTLVCFNAGGTAISDLSADTDYIDGVNGWEDFVVYDACVRAAIREERDPSAYAAFRDEAATAIRESAIDRTGDPDYVIRRYRVQGEVDWC